MGLEQIHHPSSLKMKRPTISDLEFVYPVQGCKYEKDEEEEIYFDAVEPFKIRSNKVVKGQVVGQKSEKRKRQKSCAALIPQYEELSTQQENRLVGLLILLKKHLGLRKVTHDADNECAGASNNGIENTVEKRRNHFSFKTPRYRANVTSILIFPILVPCAEGTSQSKHQVHSEIYQSTLEYVSWCPISRKYKQRSLEKCAAVCGSFTQDGNCSYHCMRDPTKTRFAEFCAIPKILFGYCPEFDPVDQTIQKDLTTPCNSKSPQRYYFSSDISFCDPKTCLQLKDTSVSTGATTSTTQMNKTTEINSGGSQEWLIPLIVVVATVIVAIFSGCIHRLFLKRRTVSAHTRKMAKKRNRNGVQYENDRPLV